MRLPSLLSASWFSVRSWPAILVLAACATGLSTGTSLLLEDLFNVYTLANLFLLAVLVSALLAGIRGGVITAVCASLAFNYFFIPPKFTLFVAHPDDLFALFMFLLTALVTGGLTGIIREQFDNAEHHSQSMQSLAALSGRLSAASSTDQIIAAISDDLVARWAVAHQISIIHAEKAVVVRSWPDEGELGEGPDRLTLIIRPAHGPALSLRLAQASLFDPEGEHRSLLEAALAQAVIALERTALVKDNEEARAKAEKEQLRASLLSSVSHDLRTPLASIIGSASTLRQFDATLEPQTKRELAEAIEDEAVRLSRFIDHLLAVTRTESGFVGQAEGFDLAEILHATVERARRYFDRHSIALTMQEDLPLLSGFPALVEQGLFNLLENAAKYSPAGSQISVTLWRQDDRLVVSVSDEGSGIAPADQDVIFDKFVRLKSGEGQMGAGLGLTITRNIASLMQATVSVVSPLAGGRGSCFSLAFLIPDDAPETTPS